MRRTLAVGAEAAANEEVRLLVVRKKDCGGPEVEVLHRSFREWRRRLLEMA